MDDDNDIDCNIHLVKKNNNSSDEMNLYDNNPPPPWMNTISIFELHIFPNFPITSDEDFVNLVKEYDRTACLQQSSSLKIRAFLSLPPKKSSPSPPSSTTASASGSGSSSSVGSPA
ncbi:hypothetical protein OSB04_000333 [Centaurea solstitialis]|uniref:Uncharacterized protein n=1 Tax=Centaurea solstitialis TaxID=347529 RepID=A0AA38WKL0_9ASTR|nr:hypothetical protein OSB04_000333 [Centaurea solstitialis]